MKNIIFRFTNLNNGFIDYECQSESGIYYYSQYIEKAKVYDKVQADSIFVDLGKHSLWKKEPLII